MKEILNAQGVGDIVDFKVVPWGWGVIEAAPTEKQLELNPKADYSGEFALSGIAVGQFMQRCHSRSTSPSSEMSDNRGCDLLCADNVLNKTSLLMPILKAIENPTAQVPSLLFQCQHGFKEVRAHARVPLRSFHVFMLVCML